MTKNKFNCSLEKRIADIRATLQHKGQEYAGSDMLYNFYESARKFGGTPPENLWGFLKKHLLSLSDYVHGVRPYTDELLAEKCGDIINFTILAEMLLSEFTPRLLQPPESNKGMLPDSVPIEASSFLFRMVAGTMADATEKHGPLTKDMLRANAILGEEVGEVSRAILADTKSPSFNNKEDILHELAQVAATAILMMRNVLSR